MAVRPATPDDAPEIVRLGALMFESMGLDAGGEWRAAATPVVRTALVEGSAAAFVADHPDEPGRLVANALGTVSRRLPGPFNPTGTAGYVQYVSTEPAFRRRGLAREAMVALLDWYRAARVGVVELHATADGEPLYRSLGFDGGANPALRLRLTASPTAPRPPREA